MRRQTAASLISVNEIVLSRPNTGGQPAAICTSRLSRSNAVVCGGVNTASNTAVTTNENTEPSTWLLPAIAGQINQLNVPTARAGTRMPRPRFAPVPSSTTKSEPLSVIFTRHSHRELGLAASQFNTTRLTPVDRQVAKTTPTALWPSVVVTGSAVWSVPGRNAGGQSGLSGRRVWIFSTTSGNNLEDKRAIMKGDASRSE